jgi:GDPmannose 4,6-dehydratase
MQSIPKRALIFGVGGQDGSLLARRLLADGYDVHGTSRRNDVGNLRELALGDRVRVHRVDPVDHAAVADLLSAVRPSQIYNLSGQSSVGLSFGQPRETFDSHVGSTLSILESIRAHGLDCRFFNASSGEIFGETGEHRADEHSAISPRSPYGAAKAAAHLIVKSYRDVFGVFACSAFLFNHESPLRPPTFVSRRVADGVAAIKLKRAERLTLGNLQIVRDWGWADDYVECMARMLRQNGPQDFVVATGVATSLQAFVARMFARLDLDWQNHVVQEDARRRANDIAISVGDPALAEKLLGWRAAVLMPEIADRLADAALVRAHG